MHVLSSSRAQADQTRLVKGLHYRDIATANYGEPKGKIMEHEMETGLIWAVIGLWHGRVSVQKRLHATEATVCGDGHPRCKGVGRSVLVYTAGPKEHLSNPCNASA